MNHKRKQKATAAMATLLSVSTMINPMSVMAQEDGIASQDVTQKDEGQPIEKKTIGLPELPKNLKANAGTRLKEVKLPDYFTWVDGNTILSTDTKTYAARYAVDDTVYDYTSIKGYHADGHYIEFELSIDVEAEDELTISAPIIKSLFTSNTSIPSTYDATGDIPIDEAHFPDAVFRDYLKGKYDTDNNDTLSAAEIANITTIDVSNKSIADMTGIGYFTKLVNLYCDNTGINSLDVSNNTALKTLNCINTGISSLDVSNNTALTILNCSNIGINSLDVSNNIALTTLNCSVTGISSLDVSKNTALKTLTCSGTGISSLDVSKNTALTSLNCSNIAELTTLNVNGASVLTDLYCYSTGISNLDVSNNTALKTLQCYSTGISSLDVSKNTALTSLQCYSTGISNLDVSNNTALTTLDCSNTGISSLDVSKNTALTTLKCYSTGISSLDVSKNSALKTLDCHNTGISSLDVSNNTALKTLYCQYNSIAYLNLGTNAGLTSVILPSPTIELKVTEDTFNITDKFTGIDKDKVSIKSGASYASGIVSNYTAGTPIVYEYDCGIANGTNKTLKVTLKLTGLKKESSINITGTLDKDYDGKDIKPNVDKNGSTMPVTYTWEKKINETKWETIAFAPKDAGTYRVTAKVAEDTNYKAAESSPVVFTISQANNSWKNALAIYDWTYGKTASTPSAKPEFGTVASYTYSDSKTGTFKSDVPTNAGTWYVKASVTETDNYKGLEEIKQFEIQKATAPTLTLPSNLKGKQDVLLSTVTLPKGWTWVKSDTSLTVNNLGYKARLTVDDANYDYTGVDGYNATGHYVEKTLAVSVAQGENTWTLAPSIGNWIYGETASTPKGKATHGTVTFTYSDSKTGTFKSDVPTSAGTWYMKATVAESVEYAELSNIVEFKISQADNSWTSALTIDDWMYGKTASTPSAKPDFGSVTYTYSDSKTGTFKSDVPTNAGTWYVKASVIETDNYKGLEEVKQFVIKKATPTLTLPSNLKGKQDALLSTVTLPKGWTWVKGDTSLTVNNFGYKARLTVDDANYDYTGVDGYNATGHYVEKTLAVSVAQGENTWTLAPSIENWIYGETASTPKGTATHGTVNFTYSDSKTGTFKSDVPTSAGTWYMKATVAESDEYAELSNIVEFKISQADNSWTSALTINDWMYGKKASTPSATAKYGTVTYTYSDSKTGTFKSAVPTNAGTWYVKASVTETDNYKGLEEVKQFEIKKATAPAVSLPSGLDGKQDALLSTVTLPKGWTWVKGNTSLTVNNSGYKARLTVDDANYDYTGVDGYNAAGHYVEKTLTVRVAQGENTWTLAPSIENWIFGEKASTPKGTATHGTVNFTYSDSKTGTFKSDVPTSAGTWYMKATVAESDEYAELTKIVEFTISQANNSWTNTPTINDWTYGKTASTPSATATYGTVTYTYSDSKTGTFKSDVPITAGIWYMKAFVESTENYKGMEEIIAFSIKPKKVDTNSEMIVSNITSDTDLSQLVIKDGNNILLQGVDYDVYKEQNANQGKVTIQFKGNYSGTIVKTYSIKEDSSSTNTPTGDTSTLGLWTMLMTLAGGILALLNKKKQKEE